MDDERLRNTTELQGPYHLEWRDQMLCVRSHHPFHWQVILPSGIRSKLWLAEQSGAMHMTKAVSLNAGMQMVLKMEGHDDVAIKGK